jgi:hypothetical protein
VVSEDGHLAGIISRVHRGSDGELDGVHHAPTLVTGGGGAGGPVGGGAGRDGRGSQPSQRGRYQLRGPSSFIVAGSSGRPDHRRPHRAADVAELTRRCEQPIRNYDPCISCSAHFLDLTVDRSLRTERAGFPAPAPDLGPGDQGRRLLAFRHPAG